MARHRRSVLQARGFIDARLHWERRKAQVTKGEQNQVVIPYASKGGEPVGSCLVALHEGEIVDVDLDVCGCAASAPRTNV